MASYNKIECVYDPTSKTLVVHKPITNYLPNYVYQMCIKAERKEKDVIKYVDFINNDKIFKKEDLKGRYDWGELKWERSEK